jgi:hypothetical protein
MESFVAVKRFYRIIAGGRQTDFLEEEYPRALSFFERELREWVHVTMRRIYKIERVENENNC